MNTKRVTILKNLRIWLLSSVVSAILCSILFFISQQFGLFNELVSPNGLPLTVMNIISASFMFPLVGTIVLSIIQLITKSWMTMFRGVGYVFMIFSFWSPTRIDDISTPEIIVLNIMHIVVAVLFIEWVISYFSKTQPSTPTTVV